MICLPAVKNGCQNGIHRRRQAPKQYKLVYKNYHKNNNLTQFKFKLTITVIFSYVSGQQRIGNIKKFGKLLTILIAMQMRRYDVERIAW